MELVGKGKQDKSDDAHDRYDPGEDLRIQAIVFKAGNLCCDIEYLPSELSLLSPSGRALNLCYSPTTPKPTWKKMAQAMVRTSHMATPTTTKVMMK